MSHTYPDLKTLAQTSCTKTAMLGTDIADINSPLFGNCNHPNGDFSKLGDPPKWWCTFGFPLKPPKKGTIQKTRPPKLADPLDSGQACHAWILPEARVSAFAAGAPLAASRRPTNRSDQFSQEAGPNTHCLLVLPKLY